MSESIATNPVRRLRSRGRLRSAVPVCRRFGLLDVMILVAATAIGLALTQTRVKRSLLWRNLGSSAFRLELVTPLLAAWTLAVLALRWRKPRPVRARLFRQPGLVAVGAATTILVVHAVLMVFVWVDLSRPSTFRTIPSSFLRGYWNVTVSMLRQEIGPAVAGAWVILRRGGRWRPEPSWIDRLGRLIGIGWIAMALIPHWEGAKFWRKSVAQHIARHEQKPRLRSVTPIGPNGMPVGKSRAPSGNLIPAKPLPEPLPDDPGPPL